MTTYLKYTTQEIVSLSHEAPSFPDVTVCNLQPLSSSTWEEMQRARVWRDFKAMISNIREAAADRGIDWDSVDDRALSPVSLIENAGVQEAAAVGNQKKDFIVHYSFAGSDCVQEEFSYYMDSTFYNCFTFRRNFSSANETGSLGSGPRKHCR